MNYTTRALSGMAVLGMVAIAAIPGSGLAEQTQAPETMPWPQLLPDGRGMRGAKTLRPGNIAATQLTIIPSEKADSTDASWVVGLEKGHGVIKARSGQQGAYHWVTAREDRAHETRIANTLVHFASPAPPPRDMLSSSKAELEISPLKLPREHGQYRSGESWPFQVRLEGKPLAETAVYLATSQGTRRHLITDAAGRFDVVIPDDFAEHEETPDTRHGHRKMASFVLGTMTQSQGRKIISGFNYSYTPGPYADKNLSLGLGVLFLGMFTAAFLLLRKKSLWRNPS